MSSDVTSGANQPPKPDAPKVEFESIPDRLVDRDRWLLWRYEWRGDKWTKVPINPLHGHKDDPTDPDVSVSFSDIKTAYQSDITSDGVGFVFDECDKVVGIDIDDCRDPDTGETTDKADSIVSRLDSWCEVSPSGTGYHLYVVANLPDGRNRHDDVEIYDEDRFFTVTGNQANRAPDHVAERNDELAAIHADYVADETIDDGDNEPHQSSPVNISDSELVATAKDADNGDKFTRLWKGNTAGYDSHSEADQALCTLLAFWTGKDKHRIDSLFRQSDLMRDKWERDDYRQATIDKAVSLVSETYNPATTVDSPPEPKGLTDEDGGSETGSNGNTSRNLLTPKEVKLIADIGPDESIGKLSDKKIAAAVWKLIKQSKRYHVRHDRESGTIYGFDNDAGVWKDDGVRNLRFACVEILDDHYGANILRELETRVRADREKEITTDDLGVEAGKIAVKNGLLDLSKAADGDSGAVRPLEPQDLATTRLPVEYDPDAPTDFCESFISDVVESGKLEAVQEYIGYCLHRGELPFNRALLLVGSGANGKSTFLSMVRELLGQQNTESKPVHQFDQQNVVADLHGKIANIDADLSEGSLSKRGVAMFKRLLGDDTVSARQVYQEAFSFTPEAKHLYACNKVPDVSNLVTDDDQAFWRRWIIVEFPRYFTPDERDPTLERKLTSDENLSGLLNWAIEGWSRLMEQGHFTNIETTADETRRLWQSWGESVDEFIVECLETDPDADNISTTAVNEVYREWCNREGKHAEPNRSTVTKKIKECGDDFGYKKRVRTTDKKNPANGYKKLGFTDEAPRLERVLSDDTDDEDRDQGRNSGLGEYDDS